MTGTSPTSSVVTVNPEIDKKKQDDSSAREFKKALTQAEGNADGKTAKELMDAGQAYRQAGNLIAAAEQFNAAGNAYKDDPKKAAEAFKQAGEAYRYEASLQDREAAAALYGKAAENYGLSAASYARDGNGRGKAEALTMMAFCLSNLGDKQSAYEAYHAAGDAFRELGDKARAAEAYKNAASLVPRGK